MKTITIYYRQYAKDGEPVLSVEAPISEDNLRKLKQATVRHISCSVHGTILDIIGAISRLAGINYSVCDIYVPGVGVVSNE